MATKGAVAKEVIEKAGAETLFTAFTGAAKKAFEKQVSEEKKDDPEKRSKVIGKYNNLLEKLGSGNERDEIRDKMAKIGEKLKKISDETHLRFKILQ